MGTKILLCMLILILYYTSKNTKSKLSLTKDLLKNTFRPLQSVVVHECTFVFITNNYHG